MSIFYIYPENSSKDSEFVHIAITHKVSKNNRSNKYIFIIFTLYTLIFVILFPLATLFASSVTSLLIYALLLILFLLTAFFFVITNIRYNIGLKNTILHNGRVINATIDEYNSTEIYKVKNKKIFYIKFKINIEKMTLQDVIDFTVSEENIDVVSKNLGLSKFLKIKILDRNKYGVL